MQNGALLLSATFRRFASSRAPGPISEPRTHLLVAHKFVVHFCPPLPLTTFSLPLYRLLVLLHQKDGSFSQVGWQSGTCKQEQLISVTPCFTPMLPQRCWPLHLLPRGTHACTHPDSYTAMAAMHGPSATPSLVCASPPCHWHAQRVCIALFMTMQPHLHGHGGPPMEGAVWQACWRHQHFLTSLLGTARSPGSSTRLACTTPPVRATSMAWLHMIAAPAPLREQLPARRGDRLVLPHPTVCTDLRVSYQRLLTCSPGAGGSLRPLTGFLS